MKLIPVLVGGALLALAACTSLLGDFGAGSGAPGDDGGPGSTSDGSTLPDTSVPEAAPPGDACAGDACTVTCTGTETACGATCVDLGGTSAHCGACGHDCGGGTCSGGECQPQPLITGLGAVKGFAIDPTRIFFSVDGTVSACPLRGCVGNGNPIATLVGLRLIATAGGSVAFVGDDPTITTLTKNPTALFACPGAGCPAPPLQRIAGGFPASGSYGFNELLGVGPDVYYQWNVPAAMYGHAVGRCVGLTGTACTSMFDVIPNGLPPIAADAANVYFLFLNATTQANDLAKCANAAQCSAPTVVVPGVSPTAMTVFGGNVYYVTIYAVPLGGGPLFTCPTSGCAKGTAFATLPTETIADVTADASGVYFTAGSKVYTCPLSGCSAAGPRPLATGQASPGAIRTDARFVYWVNAGPADGGTGAASILRVAK